MAENQSSSFADSIREARQRMAAELRAQAEQIQKLDREFAELRLLHERTEQEATRQWDEIAQAAELASTPTAPQVSPDSALENVLSAVRGLMTCTIPEQVFEVVTEESAQWGVRAAIFDVRGKSAWGAAAHGFGPALSEQGLRSLIVQLNQDNPFRQVCESAGPVDASAETLKKNRNLLDKFRPAPHATILLLPIRSAGTVTAIFYTDSGEKGEALPVNALKILAEFAGAQIDRLIALSGGFSEETVQEEVTEVAERVEEAPVEAVSVEPMHVEFPAEEPVRVEEPPVETVAEEGAAGEEAPVEHAAEDTAPVATYAEEPAVEAPVVEETAAELRTEVEVVEPPAFEPEPPAPLPQEAVEAPEPVTPMAESELASPVVEAPEPVAPMAEGEPAPPPVVEAPLDVVSFPIPIEAPPTETTLIGAVLPAPAAFDVSQLSEADQKLHRDAKRFAKLLVSEIELYNKGKVADGRRNRDLYKRLKSDIDRSRQTFEKRFGKVLNKQFDYLHDEIVRTLASNDSTVLGPEYPGPTA